jgi:alanine dehydrogenase
MLILDRTQITDLIDLDELIDSLEETMVDLSEGRTSVPPRSAAQVPDREGALFAMPGFVPSAGMLLAKLVTLFPGNAGTVLPTHQAIILTFDPDTGEPVALLDGTAITAIRTGACSALSARLLARQDAAVLAILGTGTQARSHARAMCRVRPIRQIRIAGRDQGRARQLAAELGPELGVETVAESSYAAALEGADIAAATTHAVEPVVRRGWLSPGVHVTSVGYNRKGREVDDATIADALVCVESRRATLAPFPSGSNDLLEPIRDGVITADHVHAELGQLLTGALPGRTTPEQITLYKSVGVAEEDAAAAGLVLAAARSRGIGTHIDL